MHTLFVEPFVSGHQFGYNFSAWFVPALFLIQIANICMRRILSLLKLKYEYLITVISLVAGMLTVEGHVWDYYKIPGRILFMFPVYQLGRLYKRKLEDRDTPPNSIYFGVAVLPMVR